MRGLEALRLWAGTGRTGLTNRARRLSMIGKVMWLSAFLAASALRSEQNEIYAGGRRGVASVCKCYLALATVRFTLVSKQSHHSDMQLVVDVLYTCVISGQTSFWAKRS